jgi:colanic acid biosynthesis glycosyl transferase WcaI
LKFTFLTQYFPPEIGAAQVRLSAFSRALTALGHEVEIVTAFPNHPTGQVLPGFRGKFYQLDAWHGMRVHRLWIVPALGSGLKRLLNYFSFTFSSIYGLFRTSRADFVFVESPPLFLSLSAFLFSAFRLTPFIFNVADLWPDSVRELGVLKDGPVLRFAEWFERWSYQQARFVVAVTDGISKVLIEKKSVPPEKVLFLPNGVDTEMFQPRAADQGLIEELNLQGKTVFLYAGTIGVAHGVAVLLEAAQAMRNDQVCFLIAGDGSERQELEARANQLGLTNLRFLGAVTPERVNLLYSIAFVGLSTLRDNPLFEGTRPVKIFASMACAKAVVYSGAGEGARLVQTANAGVVVPPEDPVALAKVLRDLMAQPDRAQVLGQDGRSYVLEHLTWGVLVKTWVDQLQERMGEHRGT